MNQFTVSLWGDEAWAATLISKSYTQILEIVSRDTSPPFYYFLAHFWTTIFGNSEIALRSLSFLFIILTAVFTGLIAHEFWHNQKITLSAAVLTFLNPFLFQYAFEARIYALLVLMSTVATYFFVKKKWLWYVIFAALSLYTHHFSIFVIFWHFLWHTFQWFKSKKHFWKHFSPFICIGLLYLPWLPTMYQQTKMVTDSGFWLGKPVPKDILEIFYKFFAGLNQYSWQRYAFIVGIITLIVRRWKIKDEPTWFLIGLVLTPIIIVFLMSQVVQPIFYDRYMINLIPGFILILISHPRFKLIHTLLILAFIASLIKIDYWFFTNPTKRPFREMAAFIKSEITSTDSLINWSGQAHHLFESKYYGVYGPIYTPNGSLPFYTGTALMEDGDQIAVLPNSPRLGVMTSDSIENVKITGYQLSSQKQFDSLNFSWWIKTNETQ